MIKDILFKDELLLIKKICDLNPRDCKKCVLNESISVYVSYECYSYEMTICELMDNVNEYSF